uniref:Single-stranded DNA binding protein Ssb-like OB fold domain-containing protein n=2 Tax=Noccaea caerulescens TaxID=107243 RepID=A0A1J3IXB9_NOCCA
MSTEKPALRKPVFEKVSALEPGKRGYNLIVKVGDTRVVLERTRTDGSKLKISEAVVGDASGSILLTCRNDQIDTVSKGSTIVLRNCKVEMFKNHMRLAVDKWGLIEPSKTPLNEEINTKENLSETEYELVDESH